MFELLADAVFHVAAGATGHGLLWAATLGRWRAFDGRDEVATIVGLGFWVLVGVGIALLALR